MGIEDTNYLDKIYTIEEYIALEEVSEMKHEYQAGRIRAMSGGTINHGIIGGNIFRSLANNISNSGKNCIAINNDVKVFSEKDDMFVYPDTTVVCGGIETSEKEKNSITNPMIIVEVLSKSTGNYDRGDKFRLYRSFPSFKEYILIDQDKPTVDILFRDDNNQWKIAGYVGLDKEVYINSLDIHIPMAEIYENTTDLKDPNLKMNL